MNWNTINHMTAKDLADYIEDRPELYAHMAALNTLRSAAISTAIEGAQRIGRADVIAKLEALRDFAQERISYSLPMDFAAGDEMRAMVAEIIAMLAAPKAVAQPATLAGKPLKSRAEYAAAFERAFDMAFNDSDYDEYLARWNADNPVAAFQAESTRIIRDGMASEISVEEWREASMAMTKWPYKTVRFVDRLMNGAIPGGMAAPDRTLLENGYVVQDKRTGWYALTSKGVKLYKAWQE